MESSASTTTMATGGLAVLAVYMGVIQLLRFRRVRWMKQSLKADPDEVVSLLFNVEFPFTGVKALEFALFATYGIPSVSKLLHKTGEFRRHVGKRYDETDLMLREYRESGVDSNRSKTAMERMNFIHGTYSKEISNADMLFTLSLFICEPAKWIDRFGWRRLTVFEKEALFVHYAEMGKRMGIKGVEIWKTWEDAHAFQAAYAEEFYRFANTNAALGSLTISLFVSILPKPLRPAARWGVYALIDPPLLEALGLPRAPVLLEWFMRGSLLLRAAVIRFLMPPRPEILSTRRTPRNDAADENSADVLLKPNYNPFSDKKLGCLFYQSGYKISELGPAACPAGRLAAELPSYTGKSSGGSGAVVWKADGRSPLIACTRTGGEEEAGAEAKKKA